MAAQLEAEGSGGTDADEAIIEETLGAEARMKQCLGVFLPAFAMLANDTQAQLAQ